MAAAKPPLIDSFLPILAPASVVLIIYLLASRLSEERKRSETKSKLIEAKDAEIRKLQSKVEHYEEQLERLVRIKK